MRTILVAESKTSKTYRFEYTSEELANFREAINEMFEGTKYSENKEYSLSTLQLMGSDEEGCSIINAKER